MNMKRILPSVAVLALAAAASAAETAANAKKVLVFSRCEGFNHRDSIAVGNQTIRAAAAKKQG